MKLESNHTQSSNQQESQQAALHRAMAGSAETGIRFENAERYNRALETTFARTISDVCALGDKLSILEIGAFTCAVSVALKELGHQVVASDMPFVLNDPGVTKLLEERGISKIQADLSQLPFPAEESYDLIVFSEVLEHLNFNPIPLLREFNRILKPGGKIYCATPNLLAAKNRWLMLKGKSYLNSVQDLIHNLEPDSGMSVGLHWREWSKAELVELFAAANFQLDEHKFNLYTPNRSGALRKSLVSMMFRIFPQLLPGQTSVFKKVAK